MPRGKGLIASILALAAALGTGLAGAAAGSDGYAAISVPFRVQQVPGQPVYYVLGVPAVPDQHNEGFTSNAGFVVTPAGVVVFDALGTPSLGQALLRSIRKVTDQPIKYVVASHYHADHVYGLQAFKEGTAAAIVAQERAREYVGSPHAEARLAQRRQALAPWVNETTRVVPPDITFEDELTLELGGLRFTLVYAGPAHGADDLMMLVQPAGVLFTGDIVQNRRVPFLDSDEVDSGNWMQALEAVRALQPSYIVPGHGRPKQAALEAIDFTHGYLAFLRKHMGQAVADWVPFEEAYQAVDWAAYRDLPAFDSSNKGNAYRVYLEMEREQLD